MLQDINKREGPYGIDGYEYYVTYEIPENGWISQGELRDNVFSIKDMSYGNPKKRCDMKVLLAETVYNKWQDMYKELSIYAVDTRMTSYLTNRALVLLDKPTKNLADFWDYSTFEDMKQFLTGMSYINENASMWLVNAGQTDEGDLKTLTLMQESSDNFWGYGEELCLRVLLAYRYNNTARKYFKDLVSAAVNYFESYHARVEGINTKWIQILKAKGRDIFDYIPSYDKIDRLLFTVDLNYLKTGLVQNEELVNCYRECYEAHKAGKLKDSVFEYIVAKCESNLASKRFQLSYSDLVARATIHNMFGYTPDFIYCWSSELNKLLSKFVYVSIADMVKTYFNTRLFVQQFGAGYGTDKEFIALLKKDILEFKFNGFISELDSNYMLNKLKEGWIFNTNVFTWEVLEDETLESY
jgi:hypothetical protein